MLVVVLRKAGPFVLAGESRACWPREEERWNIPKLVLASHSTRHEVSIQAALEDALTTPWPHEGSVLYAGKVALSAPAEHHDTLLGPPYAPYEPDGIRCPPHLNAPSATTLEYIGKRRRLTRHGYLADGNDIPQQQAGTDRTCPRTAEHCFQASANASLPRGRTHGQVRSPQPQDACNLTQLRHALHSLSRPDAFLWLSVRSNVT
jgi:hypothetical protein